MDSRTVSFFDNETGEEVKFDVVSQVKVCGVNYILVAESEDDDATALLLKEIETEDSEDTIVEIVDDPKEADNVVELFRQELEDIDINLVD